MNLSLPISALILGASLVIVALLMRPLPEPLEPRYEGFPVDDPNGQFIHGVFDNRTGEVCYPVIYTDMDNAPEGVGRSFSLCERD